MAEPVELGQLVVDARFLEDERVPAGERLDLGVRQGGLTDVFDFTAVDAAGHHLVNESSFALDGLPGEDVEAALGDVPVVAHLRVLVALPEGPAVTLRQVGRPPGAVEVVQGAEARLDVGTDSHLFGGADQHSDPALSKGGKQLSLGLVVLGLVDEPDHVLGNAAGDQLPAQLGVGVPADGLRGADVAEDQLKGAGPLGGPAGGVQVGPILAGMVEIGDLVGGHRQLAPVRIGGLGPSSPVSATEPVQCVRVTGQRSGHPADQAKNRQSEFHPTQIIRVPSHPEDDRRLVSATLN